MTERIENENKDENEILIGEVQFPTQRVHVFKSLDALLDFAKIFKITNFNARSGYTPDGSIAFQLTYQSHEE